MSLSSHQIIVSWKERSTLDIPVNLSLTISLRLRWAELDLNFLNFIQLCLSVNFIYSYSLFLCSALIRMGLGKSDSKTWTEKNPLWSKWFSHAMIVVGLHCGWVNSFFPNRTPRFYVQYVTDAANDKYPQYNFLFQFLPPFNPICQNFFSYYFLLPLLLFSE